MLFGKTPFNSDGRSSKEIEERIQDNEVEFPKHFDHSPEVEDLIKRLLTKSPFDRLGKNGGI